MGGGGGEGGVRGERGEAEEGGKSAALHNVCVHRRSSAHPTSLVSTLTLCTAPSARGENVQRSHFPDVRLATHRWQLPLKKKTSTNNFHWPKRKLTRNTGWLTLAEARVWRGEPAIVWREGRKPGDSAWRAPFSGLSSWLSGATGSRGHGLWRPKRGAGAGAPPSP
jgi:hypothetical protein